MAIAKKSVVWGLFAVGGTIAAFLFPALIALFLLVAIGQVPDGLQYNNFSAFVSGWFGKIALFLVISFALWHSAHRLRVVFHDFGVRKDKFVAMVVYPIAALGTVLTAWYVYAI
ncbi:MAG: fumarate reductase subunit FrdD [Xanthomonadales bacterium]|jgi:fumarate reductase subunit D|nr:fumarate reductase subunit FrdD [Xanthomonadales bacterium]